MSIPFAALFIEGWNPTFLSLLPRKSNEKSREMALTLLKTGRYSSGKLNRVESIVITSVSIPPGVGSRGDS